MLGFNPNFLYKIGFNLQNRFGGSNPKRKTSADWVSYEIENGGE